MGKLTPKQEKFCLVYIETGNATEAYRRAYNTAKMKPESINRKAKEVIDNVKISARIEELYAPAREKAMITLESHLKRLDDLSRAAESAEQYSAAIAAETNRGKACGLYTEKIDHTTNGKTLHRTAEELTDDELAAIIASRDN